jgi:SnoaL-like domain
LVRPADPVEAIERLVYAYADLLDSGDLDGLARLFERATWRSGSRVLTGTAQVRTAYEPVQIFANGKPGTQHVITNLSIDVDPGRPSASSRCYFSVLQAATVILAGRYHDTFTFDRGDSGLGDWHFTDRLILPDLRGDVSGHYR